MLTEDERVMMELLEEYAHKEMQSISKFLTDRRRILLTGEPESLGDTIRRVYERIEGRESRKG